MNLSEIIAKYGDDKVTFQKLDDCCSSMQKTKHGWRASFVTPERVDANGFEKLGLIVWMDRARVAEIIAESRAALKDSTQ